MPSPEKTKVVFVRPPQFLVGEAMTFNVHDAERLIGVLPATSFFVYECDPGHHVFSSSMENLAYLEANLLPGRIYYTKLSAGMGARIARVNMYSLHPDCAGNLWPELPRILRNVKETLVTPTEVAHDAAGAANYLQRLKKYEADPQPHDEQILPDHGQTQPVVAPDRSH
jgi:hypothetical protein